MTAEDYNRNRFRLATARVAVVTFPLVLALWHGHRLLQQELSDSQPLESLASTQVHLALWLPSMLAALTGVLVALLLCLRRFYRWLRHPRGDRSAVEFALDRERLFNHTLIEANPAFVVAISPEGEVLRMNESMLRALGYRREEVLGRNYLSCCVPPLRSLPCTRTLPGSR